jgi:DNA-directed RNA polymerase II subunit RPB2
MSFKSYNFDETMDDDGSIKRFFNPKNLKDVVDNNNNNYDKLDENGIVKEGEYVDFNDIIVAFTKTKILPSGKEINNVYGESVKFMTSGIVDRVIVTKNRDGLRKCKIRIFKNQIPDVGDKYASRCGQKGMCGMLLDQRDMPFTKDGIVPDLMINPHAIPSRMTINQFLEVVLGKSSVLCGRYGDATPFLNNRVEDYTNILEKMNYEKHADEVMYSGITGDQIHTSIFIGPTYYQRLKIMVADKMFSRSTGPIQNLTRQPAEGRGHQGGLRIGEMERDSILGHGVAGFLNESMMERSDKYNVQIDKYTGLICYDDKPLYEKNIIQIPYASKLLIQELQTMSIAPRLVTSVDIDNPILFQHMNDIYSSKM